MKNDHNDLIYSIFKYIIGEGRLWGFGPGLAGPAGRGTFSIFEFAVYRIIMTKVSKSHRLNDFQAQTLATRNLYSLIMITLRIVLTFNGFLA